MSTLSQFFNINSFPYQIGQGYSSVPGANLTLTSTLTDSAGRVFAKLGSIFAYSSTYDSAISNNVVIPKDYTTTLQRSISGTNTSISQHGDLANAIALNNYGYVVWNNVANRTQIWWAGSDGWIYGPLDTVTSDADSRIERKCKFPNFVPGVTYTSPSSTTVRAYPCLNNTAFVTYAYYSTYLSLIISYDKGLTWNLMVQYGIPTFLLNSLSFGTVTNDSIFVYGASQVYEVDIKTGQLKFGAYASQFGMSGSFTFFPAKTGTYFSNSGSAGVRFLSNGVATNLSGGSPNITSLFLGPNVCSCVIVGTQAIINATNNTSTYTTYSNTVGSSTATIVIASTGTSSNVNIIKTGSFWMALPASPATTASWYSSTGTGTWTSTGAPGQALYDSSSLIPPYDYITEETLNGFSISYPGGAKAIPGAGWKGYVSGSSATPTFSLEFYSSFYYALSPLSSSNLGTIGTSAVVVRSSDGNLWSSVFATVTATTTVPTIATANLLYKLKAVNGTLYALGNGNIYYTTNGTTWTTVALANMGQVYDIAYNAGAATNKYVVVGVGTGGSASSFYYSANGTSWTSGSTAVISGATTIQSVTSNGTIFVCATAVTTPGSAGGLTYHTTDAGANAWVAATTQPSTGTCNLVTFLNSTLIAYSGDVNGFGSVWTTSDGITYTNQVLYASLPTPSTNLSTDVSTRTGSIFLYFKNSTYYMLMKGYYRLYLLSSTNLSSWTYVRNDQLENPSRFNSTNGTALMTTMGFVFVNSILFSAEMNQWNEGTIQTVGVEGPVIGGTIPTTLGSSSFVRIL